MSNLTHPLKTYVLWQKRFQGQLVAQKITTLQRKVQYRRARALEKMCTHALTEECSSRVRQKTYGRLILGVLEGRLADVCLLPGTYVF